MAFRQKLFGVIAVTIVSICAGITAGKGQDGVSQNTRSNTEPDVQRQTDDGTRTVEACWSAWLNREGLAEGKNQRGDEFLIVQKGMETVQRDLKATQWLAARNAAFGRAEIAARRLVSDSVATTIRSERSLVDKYFGGDTAPEDLQAVTRNLSIADKIDVLADSALDSEIKKFKPGWNGNGVDNAQKRKELLKTVGDYRENIASHSNLYVSGAFTPIQCEGPNQDGDYTVLTGLIWSPKLAKIAESIWNPSVGLPPSSPQQPLSAQFGTFSSENPDWLAYTLGARIFTDEKGEKVVVGFGAAPQTSLLSMDTSRASLAALASIQRFVAEQVQAQSEQSTASSRAQYADGSQTTADSGKFEDRVDLRSKEVKVQGATQVKSWRGLNPLSGAKMQVVALAWSARWADDARQTAAEMGRIENRMQRQGGIPSGPAPSEPTIGSGDGGVAVPVRSGAHSSTNDF